jgi:hypothetical protein
VISFAQYGIDGKAHERLRKHPIFKNGNAMAGLKGVADCVAGAQLVLYRAWADPGALLGVLRCSTVSHRGNRSRKKLDSRS